MTTYGALAEFDAPEELVAAAAAARRAGYRQLEAYSPYPVEELEPILGRRRLLPFLAAAGVILGGAGAYLLQYYISVIDYPINVGGRPLHSWPMFLPATIILAILGAALAVTIGMLAINRLPQLHHPIFNGRGFERASIDRFFLCIEAEDPAFDAERTLAFLESLSPRRTSLVPQ